MITISETREPEYVVLDWDDDFKLDANVDSIGEQRFGLMGYIQKRKADGIYQAPLLPQLFYGADGSQLHTWRQNFTATGEQTVLRRDSGNPFVPDSDLAWRKIYSEPSRTARPTQVTSATVASFDLVPILVLVGVPIGLYVLYKVMAKLT